MKILLLNFILHTPEKGIITRRETNKYTMIYTMARGFKKAGHDVTLLASEEYRPLNDENPGFKVIYFPSRLPEIFKPDLLPYPKGLKKWLKNNSADYDLAITSEVFMMPSLIAYRSIKCNLVIWQELSAYQKFMHKLPAKFWYNIIGRLFMRNAKIIPRSENAYKFITKFFNKISTQIVDHGADSDIFFPGEKAENSFVVISQLIKRKRIDTIIEKFADLIKIPLYSSFLLHIIGEGEERQNLENLAETLGIKNNVIFHGFLFHKEAAPIARKTKAILINTENDLNLVSVPESIINGTPVLMNTVPNTSIFVNKQKVGIAKDEWGATELIEMIDRYDEFHQNCIRVRDELTNVGAAKKLIEIAQSFDN